MSGPLTREQTYLQRLTERLRRELRSNLVGVYAGGSYALGDYRRPRSDLDVAAVVRERVEARVKRRIVKSVRHRSFPCPARGLELVVYKLQTTRSGSAEPDFELNLNTGSGMAERVDLEPGGERHWFAIDRSILAQAGIALSGPPASQVFAPIGLEQLRPALAESIAWRRRRPGARDEEVLNASRALRFVRDGVWSSKSEAGRWALEQGVFTPETLREALATRGA